MSTTYASPPKQRRIDLFAQDPEQYFKRAERQAKETIRRERLSDVREAAGAVASLIRRHR